MQPGPMVYGPLGEQVADCRSVFLAPNEDGHNARLIAAAPNLLTALIDAKAMLEVYVTGKQNNTTHGQTKSTLRDTAKAIAKARGETK